VSKLTIFSLAAVIFLYSATSCKKTTNNTTVVKDSIYYSPWNTISMSFDNTDSFYYQDFNNSRITPSIIRSGAILGYFGFPGQSDTSIQSAAEFDYIAVSELIGVGVLELQTATDISTSQTGALYRYVIIPGNVLATSSLKGMTKEQLNKMKFTDIQKALNNAQSSAAGNQPALSGN
jgi:hypothetical protein